MLDAVGFLAAMGLGLGSIVDDGARAATLGGVSYLDFIAPGLLAATRDADRRSSSRRYPVLGAIKWDAAVPRDARHAAARASTSLAGHLLCVVVPAGASPLRCSSSIMVAVRRVRTRRGRCCCMPGRPCSPGWRSRRPIFAFAATRETDSGFALLFRFGIMPMFLFSGTFFPVSQLPDWLEPVAWLTPLWHGVDLCRDLALGHACAAAGAGARRLPGRCGSSSASWLARAHLHAGGWSRDAPPRRAAAAVASTRPASPPAASAPAARATSSSATCGSTAPAGWCSSPGFFEPVFYLFSIGVGVSQLVGDVELPGGQVVSYTAFVAPAMLAASAMNGAIYRRDVQPLLQAEVQQAVRRGAGDAGRPPSTSRSARSPGR